MNARLKTKAYVRILLRSCLLFLLAIQCRTGHSENSTNQGGVTNIDKVSNAEREKALWRLDHKDLLRVRYLQTAQVQLMGSASKLGLDEQELREFVNLKQKNLFTGYEMKNLPKGVEFKLDGGDITGVHSS